jgi:hypothetical protein
MKAWIKDLLSDGANASFGRVMSLLISVFVMGWDTSNLVFAWSMNSKHIPGVTLISLLPDAGTLTAQGIFMMLFYSATKLSEAKAGYFDKPSVPLPPAK